MNTMTIPCRVTPITFPGIYPRKNDANQFIKLILKEYELTQDQIENKTRKKEIRECRQIIHTVLKLVTPLSLNQIGLIGGKKDHSTVLHSYRAIKNQYQYDSCFRQRINELFHRLNIEQYLKYI